MHTASVKAAVLGSSDGCVSISGVIAGGAATGSGHAALARIAVGGALAATVSMGGAEMLSEGKADWSAVGAMGAGTFLGSALPAIPLFAMSGTPAWIAVVLVSFLIALCVGEVRTRSHASRRLTAYGQTLAVLALGALVGYGAGRL